MNNTIIVSDKIFGSYFDVEQYRAIIEHTFVNGVEIRTDAVIADNNNELLEEYYSVINRNLINVISVHAPFKGQNISSNDEYIRRRSIRDIEKSILIAEKLDARYLIIHASDINADISNSSDKTLIHSLNELHNEADKHDIEILVENTLPGMMLYNKEHMISIASLGFKLCFDWGHANISCDDSFDFYDSIKEYVKIIHYHSNDGKNDMHCFNAGEFKDVNTIADGKIIEIETDSSCFSSKMLIESGLFI